MVVRGVDGTDMEFLFTGEKLGVAVADSQFRFVPPAGMKVEEAEQ
jgi:outer membrane lipoprotein-sorting protein